MIPGELELFSTQQLIDELMRRATFQGVVISSKDEAKSRDWEGERVFKLRYNASLDRDEVGRLLGVVSEYLDRNCA